MIGLRALPFFQPFRYTVEGDRPLSVALRRVRQRLDRFLPTSLRKLLFQAGVSIDRFFRHLGVFLAVLVGTSVLGAAFSAPLFVLIPGVVFLVYSLRLRQLRKRRSAEFEGDFPVLLISLASALRVGKEPLCAMGENGALFKSGSVMHQELGAIARGMERGVSSKKILGNFGQSIVSQEVPLLTAAITLAQEQGSSLAPTLLRLARVVRQRQSFRRKVRAAIAMQKASALGIVASACAIGVMQVCANGEAMRKAVESSGSRIVLEVGVALIALGIVGVFRIGRHEF